MSVFGKVAHQRWIAAFAALMIASPAFAALMPGDEQTRPGLPVANFTLGPVPADYVLDAGLTLVDANDGALAGMTTSRIYRKFDGTLAFSYVVTTEALNSSFIRGADMNGPSWSGVSILEAGADGTGAAFSGTGDFAEWTDGTPHTIGRTASPTLPLSPFWDFRRNNIGTVIGPSNTSAEIWFTTNATSYTTATIAYLGQGVSGTADVLVPVIPDPATLALLGLGASGFALFRRRRTA